MSELEEFLRLGIEYVNKKGNLKELKNKYSPNENRTLMLTIISGSGSRVGFYFDENYKLNMGEVNNPTCEIIMKEKTFWGIVLGKQNFVQEYFGGAIDIRGENSLRDFLVLSQVLQEFSDVLKKLGE